MIESKETKGRDYYWLKLILFVWLMVVVIRTLDQLGFV